MESLDNIIKTLDTFPMCLSLSISKDDFDEINDRLKTDVKEKTEQLKGIHYIPDFYKVCEQLEKTVKLTIIASRYAEKQKTEKQRHECRCRFLSDELLRFIQEFNIGKTVHHRPEIVNPGFDWMGKAGMMLWFDEICWRTFVIAERMLRALFNGELDKEHNEEREVKNKDCKDRKKIAKRILKAYSLSVTLGNPIGNSINLSNPDKDKQYNGLFTINRLYNCIDGFNYNLPFLQQDIKFYMKNKLGFEFEEGDYEKVVAGTTIYKHKLLETALYLKAMTESLSIFNGMEYTPIIVNLCKAVEELETDLIAKLNEKYDFNATDFRIGQGERQPFDAEQAWREEQTIGSLQAFINALNTSYSKTKGIYDKAFANSIASKYQTLEEKTYIMPCTAEEEPQTASELLRFYMDYWRVEIRNSHLHKDNILDAEEVTKMYNDTLCLIGLLVEWYLIVSGEKTS